MSTNQQDSAGSEVNDQLLNLTIAIDQKVLAKYPVCFSGHGSSESVAWGC